MTHSSNIREATAEDAGLLAHAGTRLFLQTYDGLIPTTEMVVHLDSQFSEARQNEELADQSITTLIVECEDKLAGFAQVKENPVPVDGCEAEVELWRIYLDRAFQGMGLGQKLISRVGEAARAFSANYIWLVVWEQNPRAISFYRKMGFNEVGRQDFRVNNEIHNDLVMLASVDALCAGRVNQ